jgi:hypothetical protein
LEPTGILCEKCREAFLLASLPVLKMLADSGQIQPYPKAWVRHTILRNAKSFLRRGLDPRERITLVIDELPADFDVEQEAKQFSNELKKMDKECRSSKQPDS